MKIDKDIAKIKWIFSSEKHDCNCDQYFTRYYSYTKRISWLFYTVFLQISYNFMSVKLVKIG